MIRSGLLLFVCSVFLFSCKKQDSNTPSSFYAFIVTDGYTNQPIPGCKVFYLSHYLQRVPDSTFVGTTNNSGEIAYQFYGTSNYDNSYELDFLSPGYRTGLYGLPSPHSLAFIDIKLEKLSVLELKIRRITQPACTTESYSFNFHFSSNYLPVNGNIHVDSASLTTYYYRYEIVPSYRPTTVSWTTYLNSPCTGIVSASYQHDVTPGNVDTSYFNIDY